MEIEKIIRNKIEKSIKRTNLLIFILGVVVGIKFAFLVFYFIYKYYAG